MSDHKPESEVLKPLTRPELLDKDGDAWPCFNLNHAIVTDDAGSIVSLFDASAKLLVVTGELEFDKDKKSRYLIPFRRKPVYVELKSVGRYSFGSDEEGGIVIWAAGQAGWFEIRPATTYSRIFSEMEMAVKAWYHILDETKLHSATPKEIITKFAKKQKITPSSAEAIYHNFAGYVVRSMDDDGKDKWPRTPIYQYLKSRQNSGPSTAELAIVSAGTARQREMKRRGKQAEAEKPTKCKPVEPEKPGIVQAVAELKRVETEAAILWKFMQRTSEQKVRAGKLTLKDLTEHLWNDFVFDSPKQAENYVRFQSPNLVKFMQDRRRRKEWIDSPLYEHLMSSNLSPNLRGKLAQIRLHAREYPLADALVKGGVDSWDTSDEEIEVHHTKSFLRPRGAGKKSKSYTGKETQEDDEESVSETASKKRKGKELGTEPSRLRKRRALSAAQSSEHSTAEDLNNELKSAEQTLPLRWKNDATLSPNAPAAVRGATLSPEANAAGDVWRCKAPGCLQAIYGARRELGGRLIDDHIEEHRKQERDQPQLDLVMNEMKKTNLPVANLIKRIREFTAAKDLSDAVAGAEQLDVKKPQRIRRLAT